MLSQLVGALAINDDVAVPQATTVIDGGTGALYFRSEEGCWAEPEPMERQVI